MARNRGMVNKDEVVGIFEGFNRDEFVTYNVYCTVATINRVSGVLAFKVEHTNGDK